MDKLIQPVKQRVKTTTLAVTTSRTGLLSEFVILLVLPLMLFRYYPAVMSARHAVLFSGLAYVYLVYRAAKFTRLELGLTLTNTLPALYALIAPSALVLLVSTLLLTSDRSLIAIYPFVRDINYYGFVPSVLAYAFFSVPLQELIFRGFYLSRLERLSTNRFFLLTYSAFVFMLIHVLFDSFLLFLITGVMGVVWADNFLRYRSLPAIIISHATLGGFLIYFINLYF